MKTDPKNPNEAHDVLDVILYEAALAGMEDPMPTPKSDAWKRELVAETHERLGDMHRAQLPEAAPIRRVKAPRPGLVAMVREGLMALAEQLVREHGAEHVQFAHRDLSTLSDDDLRNLITHLEDDESRE